MKRSSQVVAILGVMVFSVFFAANVSAQAGPVAGVYENFTVGKESGDLYLTIKIERHPFYEIEDDDLYYELTIDLYTAVLGGKKKVKLINGKTINLDIPKGTDNDNIFRIGKFGMKKTSSGGERGELFVRIKVETPKNLSKKELALFEELSKLRNE